MTILWDRIPGHRVARGPLEMTSKYGIKFYQDRAPSNEKKIVITMMGEKIQGWDEIKREADMSVVAATG